MDELVFEFLIQNGFQEKSFQKVEGENKTSEILEI